MIKRFYAVNPEDYQTLIDILNYIKQVAIEIEENGGDPEKTQEIKNKADVGMFLLFDGFYN